MHTSRSYENEGLANECITTVEKTGLKLLVRQG